jgi:hypothetical protein
MTIDKEKIYEARKAGYSNDEIVSHLNKQGYGQQIEQARSSGYSIDNIVDNFAGEEKGFTNRIKQGATDFGLSIAQMGNYLGQKTGLGDIRIGTDGINYESPDDLAQRQPLIQDAIRMNEMKKGDTGIATDFAIAAGNPLTWLSGIVPGGAVVKGLVGGAGLEMGTPQEQNFDPKQKAIDTSVAGGVGAAAGPVIEKVISPFTSAISKSVGYLPRKSIGMVTAPMSKKLALPRARKSLSESIPDREFALKNMERETISELTPAQRSGSEDLMALQNKVGESSPDIRLEINKRNEASRHQLGDALNELGGGNPAQTRSFIEGRRDNILNKVNESTSKAREDALTETSKVLPTKRTSDASMSVRDELESSLSTSKGQERELWSKVPEDVQVGTTSTKAKLQDLVDNTPIAQKDDLPSDLVGQVINGDTQSIRELQGLRSRLLEESRIAKSAGNYNKARISDNLADSVLEDMGAQANNIQGEAGEALRTALDFSRESAQKFKKGSVGKVLGSDKFGGEKVAPELTLDKTVGTGGNKGAVAISELENAAPTENLKDGVSQYVMNSFKNKAIKDDIVDPKAAKKFIEDNVDILDKLPDLKANIESSIGKSSTFATKSARSERLNKSLFSKSQSRAAEYLDAPVGKEFERILNSKNPGGLTAQLRRQVAKDPSGEALKGLKTSSIEYIMDKSSMKGKKMMEMIKGKKLDPVMRELFSNAERKRFFKIADELRLIDGTERVASRVVNDNSNKIIHMLVTTAGARAGAKLGHGTSGASLKTASAGSKLAGDTLKKFTVDKSEKLIMDSILDPDLMKTLLMNADSPIATKKLNSWLIKNEGIIDGFTGATVGQQINEIKDKEEE